MYPRNMLIQPGPLSSPRKERTMDTPSFRVIDFGRAEWAGTGGFESLCEDDLRRVKRDLRLY